MVSNRIIKIDLNKKTKNVVQMVQGDTNRKLTINVYDSDEPYLVNGVGGETIHGAVYIEKPDGTTCGYDTLEDDSPAVTGSGNTLTVYFVPQATTAHGWAYMTVSVFDDDGVELNTFGIDLFIDKKATATISADYWNLKSIEGLTAAVEGLTQQMVRSVNHATADTNGNVTLLPWQLPYNGVVGGQQVGDVEEALDGLARMQSEIISQEIKEALVNAFNHVAWTDEHGQDYVDALEQAMGSKLVSISAVFAQGTAVIYNSDELDTLRQYLTVTAHYSDTTTKTVTTYTLSGTLTEGTSTITVSYGGKTTTFVVIVSAAPPILPVEYQQVEYIKSSGTQYINLGVQAVIGLKIDMFVKWVDTTSRQLHGGNSGFYFGVVNGKYQMSQTGTTTTDIIASTESYDHIIYNRAAQQLVNYSVNGETGSYAGNVTANPGYIGLFNMLDYVGVPQNYKCSCYLKDKVVINNNGVTYELYPCYRKADGVIGMYDIVGGTFYTNAGTGVFEKGADI